MYNVLYLLFIYFASLVMLYAEEVAGRYGRLWWTLSLLWSSRPPFPYIQTITYINAFLLTPSISACIFCIKILLNITLVEMGHVVPSLISMPCFLRLQFLFLFTILNFSQHRFGWVGPCCKCRFHPFNSIVVLCSYCLHQRSVPRYRATIIS